MIFLVMSHIFHIFVERLFMEKKETDDNYYLKHKDIILSQRKERYEQNKDKELLYNKEYAKEHRDELNEYLREYAKTPNGRASKLLYSYRRKDKLANRGECTLTKEWILENIIGKPCVYCGETDMLKVGCDRKDSSLPHTPDNCVPCCKKCNSKKKKLSYEDYIKMLGK